MNVVRLTVAVEQLAAPVLARLRDEVITVASSLSSAIC
jgi:hypothetical protein